MVQVIGVRFKKAGKIYYFLPAEAKPVVGNHVIVETARGIEYGAVVLPLREVDESTLPSALKPIIRVSTPEDDSQDTLNKEKEREAFNVCVEKIKQHELPMKLIDVEYTFDGGKIVFYFTSESRVDFRDLVKDLAFIFRTRIELRQIGVRDEAKIMGGYSTCGRVLCCHSLLGDFEPVSIRMAKAQNISLNPAKISGVCGRLMCCLKFEHYEDMPCKRKHKKAAAASEEAPDYMDENIAGEELADIVTAADDEISETDENIMTEEDASISPVAAENKEAADGMSPQIQPKGKTCPQQDKNKIKTEEADKQGKIRRRKPVRKRKNGSAGNQAGESKDNDTQPQQKDNATEV